MEKKAYMILEIGWEYNDEYYSTGDGETYEAPEEIFLDKNKAAEALLKKEIAAYRYSDLQGYIGENDLSDFCEGKTQPEDIFKFFKDEFDDEIDEDDYYELEVPSNATDAQIKKLLGMLTLRFFKLHTITITE